MPDEAPKNAPASAARADSTIVPQVPDHEMIRRIGGGSYGEVWLARSVMGTYRAVKIVYRDSFDNDRPFDREFNGIQKFEPISRSHESQVDILQVGKGEGYFYYVMELADDASAECGVRSAECGEPTLTRPAATLSHPMGEGRGEGSQSQASTLNPQPALDPASYVPRTLGRELYQRGKLPFEECLRISLSLTTALEHLHQHGLVHRDIKPSNIIFVNGIPKLADIGLVTSIDATVSYVGTEGFLAPEGPGTPQGDIYSLGKVLYEICTGRDRQDFPELPTNLAELPDREGLLEFNAIISKACKNAPSDRYQSATEMHADIVLLQSGKSVRRVRSLERRLARATKIGMMVAALGGVMALAFLFQRHETREARRLAEDNRRLAAESQQVAQFLKDMVQGVGPSVALGRDTTMLREILDKTTERVGKDLTNQPEVEIELLWTIADTYGKLGLYGRMEEIARENLRLSKSRLGEENPSVANALLQIATARVHLHDLVQSELLARRALGIHQKLGGGESRDIAVSLTTLGNVLWSQEKYAESETMLRQALEMKTRLLGNGDPSVREASNDLAEALVYLRKLPEAETIFREELRRDTTPSGKENPQVVRDLSNLGWVFFYAGNFPKAETNYYQALAMARKLLGDNHPDVAQLIHDLLDTLMQETKYSDVEKIINEIVTPALEHHPQNTQLLRVRILDSFLPWHRWTEAIADEARIIDLEPKNCQPYHGMAALVAARGDLEAYRRLCQRLLTQFGETTEPTIADPVAKNCLILPSSGVDLVTLSNLAQIAVSDPNLPLFQDYQFCKGLAEYRQGHFASATDWLRKALGDGPQRQMEVLHTENWERPLEAFMILAMANYHLNRIDEARAAFARGVEIEQTKLPRFDSPVWLGASWTDRLLGRALMQEAKALLESGHQTDAQTK